MERKCPEKPLHMLCLDYIIVCQMTRFTFCRWGWSFHSSHLDVTTVATSKLLIEQTRMHSMNVPAPNDESAGICKCKKPATIHHPSTTALVQILETVHQTQKVKELGCHSRLHIVQSKVRRKVP